LLPSSRVQTTVTRTWTDANGNFAPDCNLRDPLAQDNRTSGGDFCGQISDLNFGKPVNTLFYDPNILQGWYSRPDDWIISATVQHEILPRVSVSAGAGARLQHFTVTDNRAQSVADYTPFSVTAPLDSRLPGGGGYVVSGLQRSPGLGQLGQLPHVFGHISQIQRGRYRCGGAYERLPTAGRSEYRAARD
jgi:hypothetical protein